MAQFEREILKIRAKSLLKALTMVRNLEDAEDIVSATEFRAFSCRHQFRGDSLFSTWFTRILINKANELKRTRKCVCRDVRKESSLEVMAQTGWDVEAKGTPEEILRRKEFRDLIDAQVAEMKPKYREMFLLRDIDGFTLQEIVDMTGKSLSTVKTSLWRAREIIRKSEQGPLLRSMARVLG